MRKRPGAGLWVFAAAVACGFLLAGVALTRGASQTLRVTTRLVQVNVIALDHHGSPVRGLTRDDFKVYDNGKPQKIAIFRVETNQPPAVHMAPPPPDTFSNAAERAETAPPSVTVILLDALNTRMGAQLYARKQVLKFLEQLEPNDYVALYALTNRLLVLHDFTTDDSELLQALRHYQARYVSEAHSGEPRGDFPGMLGQFLGGASAVEGEYYARQRVRITTDALISIASHLAGLRGRKNLIWVSAGFPLAQELDQMLGPNGFTEPLDFSSQVSRAARALNNVNLAIYPVDANGLMVEPGISAANHSVPSTRVPTGFQQNFLTMDELAQRTGGRAFYNSNDIHGSIRRVVDDSRVTYVLAYYPRGVEWKGEFRKIKVRVDRHGVQLQYRHGYSALPAGKPPANVSAAALAEAVASPLDATGIRLTVRVIPGGKANPVAYVLRLQIDPKDVTFGRQGTFRTASLTVVTNEFGPKGKSLKGISQKVQLNLKPATYREILARGLGIGERLPAPIPYDTERLRVVVRDDATGRMGLVNVPLNRETPSGG